MKLIYLGEELDSNIEHELYSENEFGFNVTVTYTKDSFESKHLGGGQFTEKRFNCTEVHHRYKSFHGIKIAVESDIHCTGGTIDVVDVECVIIELATFKSAGYYD